MTEHQGFAYMSPVEEQTHTLQKVIREWRKDEADIPQRPPGHVSQRPRGCHNHWETPEEWCLYDEQKDQFVYTTEEYAKKVRHLSVRARNVIGRYAPTADELERISWRQLENAGGCGAVTLKELEGWIDTFNLPEPIGTRPSEKKPKPTPEARMTRIEAKLDRLIELLENQP